jgi:hypothetical protein
LKPFHFYLVYRNENVLLSLAKTMCEKFLSNWAFLLTVIAIKLTVKH